MVTLSIKLFSRATVFFFRLNVTVPATNLSVKLKGLLGDTTYRITIYSFTNMDGVISNPVYVTTPEGGKFNMTNIFKL